MNALAGSEEPRVPSATASEMGAAGGAAGQPLLHPAADHSRAGLGLGGAIPPAPRILLALILLLLLLHQTASLNSCQPLTLSTEELGRSVKRLLLRRNKKNNNTEKR